MPWKTDAQLKTKYYLRDREMHDDAIVNDLIKGYKYGERTIKYDVSMNRTDLVDTNKSLSIVGFVEPRHLYEQHFMGTGTWAVVANPKYPASEKMFVSLVSSLKKYERVILGRYVYRNGCRPKMVALFADYDDLYEDEPYRSNASLMMLELGYKGELGGCVDVR